jgi:superfamily II DNA/RNA helicase
MTTQVTNQTFADLGINEQIVANLAALGLTQPTPVQAQAIPILLQGRDLIAKAPTGTGKTAAFLLPGMNRMVAEQKEGRGPRVLVLTPTRELAQQVTKAAISFGRGLRGARVVCITGGEPYPIQNRELSKPYDILVATPGRLLDQMNNGRVHFERIEMLVLDEADRMLDLGFADDMRAIADAMPQERQSVCFTATLSSSVVRLASDLLNNPEKLEVAQQESNRDSIDQQVIFVDHVDHKRELLNHLLNDATVSQAIVFTATKRDADQLALELEDAGQAAGALHGDLNQRQRTRMLDQLRSGRCRILVATDVAARGIDVAGITHVFNFDLPRQAEDYVHRIGRTGRAGATGTAISFVSRRDIGILRNIEHYVGDKVRVIEVEGLEARFKPQEGDRGSAPRGHHARPGSTGGGYRGAGHGNGGGNGGGYRGASAGAGAGNGEGRSYGRGGAGNGNGGNGGGYGGGNGNSAGARGNGGGNSYGQGQGDGARRPYGDTPRPAARDGAGAGAPRRKFYD